MDPAQATVQAAMIGVIGAVAGTLLGAVIGGIIEGGRAKDRLKAERESQQESRVRDLRQASLNDTIAYCLEVLEFARTGVSGPFPKPNLRPLVDPKLLGEITVFNRWWDVATKAENGILPTTKAEVDELDGIAGALARVRRTQSERIARDESPREISAKDLEPLFPVTGPTAAVP